MKLSVIFPVKNQSAKLLENLEKKGFPYFDSLGITYEMIIVDDGSDLPNQGILNDAIKTLPLQVKLLPWEDHSGKGHNVQKGILAADGDYVLFMDADFATDLHALNKILPIIHNYDGFIATRYADGAVIAHKTPFKRRMISWLSRRMIRDRFHFKGVSDTQCGYKLFRRDIAQAMADRQIIDGFAFDVEYLYFYKLNGFTIKEVGVHWDNDPESSMISPLKASEQFYFDMRKIKKNKAAYLLSESEKKALVSRR